MITKQFISETGIWLLSSFFFYKEIWLPRISFWTQEYRCHSRPFSCSRSGKCHHSPKPCRLNTAKLFYSALFLATCSVYRHDFDIHVESDIYCFSGEEVHVLSAPRARWMQSALFCMLYCSQFWVKVILFFSLYSDVYFIAFIAKTNLLRCSLCRCLKMINKWPKLVALNINCN